jgi:histidine triad (HIT) family protein
MPEDLYRGIFKIVRLIAPKIKEVTGFKKVGLSVVGLDMNHAHLHILPINSISDTCFENQKPANNSDLAEMASRLQL